MTAPTADVNRVDASPLRGYIAVLRRRKWAVIQCIVLVPLIALVLSHFQTAKYQSSAEVLLNRNDIAQALTGIQDPAAAQAPERLAATQAELARVPTVAQRALHSVGLKEGPEYLLSESSVVAHPDADLLDFKVTDRDPVLARRLTTAYAREFTLYSAELEQQSLQRALADVTRRLHTLEAAGQTGSLLHRDLEQRRNQLTTLQALQTAPSAVVRDAGAAAKVSPRPFRNAVLALAVGLILGIGLAFLYDTLDPRVWSAREAATALGLPLLGRIPRLKREHLLVVAEDPHSAGAQAFRMLSTNLDFTSDGERARKILITSAVSGEGKSTTAANLAIALARRGHHVVVVDLDLQGPSLADLFSLDGHVGLTDVAVGNANLRDALAVAGTSGNGARASSDLRQSSRHESRGTLEVVPAGPLPVEPGEFVMRPAVESIIDQLGTRADFVLIDTTPMLVSGDPAVLSTYVDAVMVVVRLDRIRQPTLDELNRSLAALPCPKLGVVVTATDEGERYGVYGSGYGSPRPGLEARQPSGDRVKRHVSRGRLDRS
jgi:capsular exopolysaccharide synthesis family protein